MTERRPGTLVPVAIGYGLPETVVTISVLKAYGIAVVASPGYTASVAWHWMVALGGIEICVPSGQMDVATDLLSGMADDDRVAPARPYARRALPNAIVALAITLLFQVPPPARGFFRLRSRTADDRVPPGLSRDP